MSTTLNKLVLDVERCLAKNPYRVYNSKRLAYLTEVDSSNTDEGFLFPIAVSVMVVHFTYLSAS